MSDANGFLQHYVDRQWQVVPVHRPDPATGSCSCGQACSKPGKHPDARFWPGGSSDPAAFENRNVGVQLGPASQDLADVDLDCNAAVVVAPDLLPATNCSFGRNGSETHWLYAVTDRAAAYLKLEDPALSGEQATIVELRWPGFDEAEQRYKALQTVIPPSLHHTGATLTWLRDGSPSIVAGADLVNAVRHVGAAVLIARYAQPKKRHDLVLVMANLLVRAGWADGRIVPFMTAVFKARKDTDKADKVAGSEGAGAVHDARKRFESGKPAMGLPALHGMLDSAIEKSLADKVLARIKDWLGIPDPPRAKLSLSGSTGDKPSTPKRYAPLPPWQPFPTEHLPRAVRDFVLTVSQAMRCDPTFVALPALAACAGMIGSTRQIRLKQSWTEPAVLWAVVVGDSGTLKTPPYKRAVAPIVDLQARHLKEHAAAAEQFRAELRDYERRKRKAKDEDPGDPPVEPPCTRIYSRDTTVEALAGILMANRTRFLIGRDELSGWLASFNQYKARGGSDQANWLELHSLGTLCVDRKTGEPRTIFVRGVGVSLCGGIQPGVLRSALSPQHFSAGVPARLLFAYPPRRPKEWTEDDIDEAIEANYQQLIHGLAALHPHTDEDGEPYPVTLTMTPEAKAEWVRFYRRFADKQAETDGELAAAFSKLEGYAARLALIHHVCQSVYAGSEGLEPVPLASVAAGIALAQWFTQEAERVYQMLGEENQEQETRRLVEKVNRLAERFEGRLTADQLRRSNKARYSSVESATADLEFLVSLNVGSWESRPPGPKGGRPTRVFVPKGPEPETPETSGDEVFRDEVIPDSHTPDTSSPSELTQIERGDEGTLRPVNSNDCVGPAEQLVRVSGVLGIGGSVLSEPKQSGQATLLEEEAGMGPGGVSGAVPYTLVTSREGLAHVVAAVADWSGPVALDTETTGLDPTTDRIRLLQLALGDDLAVIDLFALDDPVGALAPLFAALAQEEVIGHNLQFDLRMLAPLGFTPGRVFDTLLASRVLSACTRAGATTRLRHSLEDVVHRELGQSLDKSQQASNWTGPLSPAQLNYAAADAQVLLPLSESLKAKLAETGLAAIANLEMRAVPGVAWCGPIAVDSAAWTRVAESAQVELVQLQDQMDRLAPNPACLPGTESRNWNSTEDVRSAFRELGITLDSTDDGALAAIDHPLAALLREFRGVSKRVGTYGRAWLEKHVGADGRVLPSWNQLGADSGRMSCSDPNLQQIPRGSDYRSCFIAGPGKVLVKADYSQIELRIAARVADESVMIRAYQEGIDLHRLTAARVLGKPEAEVTRADRQIAKSLNFGLLYGMGWRGLRAYAQANYGVVLSEDLARSYREAFFRTYPGLRRWHDQVIRDLDRRFRADSDGVHEVETVGGRKRILPVARQRRDGTRYTTVPDTLNAPVQGTGADGLKAAIARLWETRNDCPGAVPVIFCHDEIVLEVAEADADRAAEWLRRCMIDSFASMIDPVPVEVEVTIGRTWNG